LEIKIDLVNAVVGKMFIYEKWRIDKIKSVENSQTALNMTHNNNCYAEYVKAKNISDIDAKI
jgi:hypothetical protein